MRSRSLLLRLFCIVVSHFVGYKGDERAPLELRLLLSTMMKEHRYVYYSVLLSAVSTASIISLFFCPCLSVISVVLCVVRGKLCVVSCVLCVVHLVVFACVSGTRADAQ